MKGKILSGLSLVCIVMGVGILFPSCSTVKEYQKSRINDSEMTLANRKVEKSELNAQSYREGSSGANSGKTGGGCGCN
jgi:beta-lactam-binding protein with PASTA domain